MSEKKLPVAFYVRHAQLGDVYRVVLRSDGRYDVYFGDEFLSKTDYPAASVKMFIENGDWIVVSEAMNELPDTFKFTSMYTDYDVVYTATKLHESRYRIEWDCALTEGKLYHEDQYQTEIQRKLESGVWKMVEQDSGASKLVKLVMDDIAERNTFDRKVEVRIDGVTYRAYDDEAEELIRIWESRKYALESVESAKKYLADCAAELEKAEAAFERFAVL